MIDDAKKDQSYLDVVDNLDLFLSLICLLIFYNRNRNLPYGIKTARPSNFPARIRS